MQSKHDQYYQYSYRQRDAKTGGDTVVPALSVFVSGVVARTVLCETAGLHCPPRSGRPRSAAYEPIPWTAEPTPARTRQTERFIIFPSFLPGKVFTVFTFEAEIANIWWQQHLKCDFFSDFYINHCKIYIFRGLDCCSSNTKH